MEALIKEMEAYAAENHVPIMQQEGIEFFQKLVEKEEIRSILELGTAIGYSAIQLARLHPDIHVVTIERDEERYQLAVENVKRSGLEKQITCIFDDIMNVELSDSFDCIFIDAAKAQYIRFFERFEANLKPGGVIVSDNLKFHGLVGAPLIKSRNLRSLVRKIQGYIDYLKMRDDYETVFYECGDGVAVSRKRI